MFDDDDNPISTSNHPHKLESWEWVGQTNSSNSWNRIGTTVTPRTLSTQEQDPNCSTYDWLVRHPEVQKEFDEVWRRTSLSGRENGGWILYELKTNTIYLPRASEGSAPVSGKPLTMPKEPEEFRSLMTDLRKQGRHLIFIAEFHTHPRSGENPYPSGSDVLNIGIPSKIAAQGRMGGITGNADGSALGIVIGANRNYSYYSQNGAVHPNILKMRCW